MLFKLDLEITDKLGLPGAYPPSLFEAFLSVRKRAVRRPVHASSDEGVLLSRAVVSYITTSPPLITWCVVPWVMWHVVTWHAARHVVTWHAARHVVTWHAALFVGSPPLQDFMWVSVHLLLCWVVPIVIWCTLNCVYISSCGCFGDRMTCENENIVISSFFNIYTPNKPKMLFLIHIWYYS